MPVKSLIGLISSNSSRRPFSMNQRKDSSWSSMRFGTSNVTRPVADLGDPGVATAAGGRGGKGGRLSGQHESGSLTEWEEGGTAALTEGEDTAIASTCQTGHGNERCRRRPSPRSGDARAAGATGRCRLLRVRPFADVRSRWRRGRSPRPPRVPADTIDLLDLDLGALLFEGRLDLLGLVLGDALLDGLRRRVDEVLGLLEAEPGELADDLDDRDLVAGRPRSRIGE